MPVTRLQATIFILTLAAIVCAGAFAVLCAAEAPRVRLLDSAQSGLDTVSLADLLPKDVAPLLRERAAGIILGKSPLPGSLRVFDAKEIARLLRQLPDV